MLSNVTFENYRFQQWVSDPTQYWYKQRPHVFRMLSYSDQYKAGKAGGGGVRILMGLEGEYKGLGGSHKKARILRPQYLMRTSRQGEGLEGKGGLRGSIGGWEVATRRQGCSDQYYLKKPGKGRV